MDAGNTPWHASRERKRNSHAGLSTRHDHGGRAALPGSHRIGIPPEGLGQRLTEMSVGSTRIAAQMGGR
jgi:hypothetical protein